MRDVPSRETFPEAPSAPAAAGAALTDLDEMAERLAEGLAASTADHTDLCWVESARGRAAAGDEAPPEIVRSRVVFVRAREGTRWGAFRAASGDPAELAAAVRQAVAASRVAAPVEGAPPEPVEPPEESAAPALWDPEVATLGRLAAREVLDTAGGRGTLAWGLCRVAVASGRGVARQAQATAVTLRVGTAAASARFLAELDPAAVAARDHLRAGPAGPGRSTQAAAIGTAAPLDTGAPLVFSQEAACELVALLARAGLSSAAFDAPGSPLAGMLDEHVFAPVVDLVDDGTDPAGLPFPFDLLGRTKRRLPLVEAGVLRSPAVDPSLALRLRRPPTPHAVGPDEARPEHLFLLPRHDEEAVFAAAEGGLWVSALDGLECFDPGRLAVRARAVGARRIAGGELAEALPPLVWEDSLLRLFSRVRAVGGRPVRLAPGPESLGGVSAPLLAVDGAEALRLLAP